MPSEGLPTDKTMDDINFVVDRLRSGEAFFFAGSGISYASNLPSAYAVLEHTANVFLPTFVNGKEKKEICKRIQPEVFYESIIGMTQSYEVLDIWRSLLKIEQKKHGLICSPNFVHLFIVEYSSKNKVPIITTNFDSMFEQACDFLNIKYDILLPTDSPPNAATNALSICKVHGSIQDNVGKYSPNTLWTTMSLITKVNTKWIKYLNKLMEKKHLCFAGYSGKDIDFFPYIAEFPKKGGVKDILWINRFEGDHSDTASKACGAVRACLYPDKVFESIASNVGVRPAHNDQMTNDPDAIERLLCFLEKSLSAKKLLTDEEKELLYCGLLSKLGHYRDAYKYATELESIKLSRFSLHSNKYLLLLTCARLSHENSRYDSCKRYAKQVLGMLKAKDNFEINAALQASCLVSEANRMSIPNDIYFWQPKMIYDYLHVFFVLAHFMLTTFTSRTLMLYHKVRYSDLSVETQHELIEHRIRFWALVQSITGSPQRGWNIIVKEILTRIWESIRDTSYEVGYAAGIANAGKFKYRLSPLEKTKTESANIYALTTSATGSELLLRNEADRLLHDGQFDESRTKFIEYADMAKNSGNTLNEIKGLVGFAYSNHIENKKPLLTDELRNRFSFLITQVEGRRWKNYFAYISTIILNDTKNT